MPGRGLSLVVVGLALLSCGRAPELPAGSFLAGDAPAFLSWMRQLETLGSSPVAQLAATARERLAGCDGFFQASGEPKSVWELTAALECRGSAALDPELEALRADADVVWGFEVAPRRHLVGRVDTGDGGAVALSAELADLPPDHPLYLLLPGAEAPGPAVLGAAGALVHGRFRADHGLDLAALVPQETQVEGLFQLSRQVFSGLVLEGVWEVAVYEPGPGELIPPIALAVEVSHLGAARVAWNAYLGEVEKTWGFFPVPTSLEGHEGACLPEVRVLPGLAPCYVFAESALIVGWNRRTLETALRGEASAELAERSRLVVELARLPAADAQLTRNLRERLRAASTETLESVRALPPELATAAPLEYPWTRLVLTGRRQGDRYRFDARLHGPGGPAGGTAP